LPRFLHQHPGLRVRLWDASDLSAARTDAAQVSVCIGAPADAGRIVQQIGTLRTITCATPELIACSGAPWTPADLSPLHCIGVADATGVHDWIFTRRGAWHSIAPAAPMCFGDAETAVAAAMRGGGYVQVLSVEVEEQVAAGLLQPVLADWHDTPSPVFVVCTPGVAQRPAVQAFCSFMAELFPSC
jgi:LysR family transcriptional regulator, regulator for bpeEF and oprC